MDTGLARDTFETRQQMRVRISTEQQHLKDEHAHGPDGWRAAEPWQNEFCQQRLNLKQQKGTREDGDCKQQ